MRNYVTIGVSYPRGKIRINSRLMSELATADHPYNLKKRLNIMFATNHNVILIASLTTLRLLTHLRVDT